MLLCKDALYTKKIRMLVQTFWEEDLSRTKGVTIDINCNLLVELKIIFLLCRGGFFCVSSEMSFRYFTASSLRISRSSTLIRFTKPSLRN